MMKQFIITVKSGVDTTAFVKKLEDEGIFIDNNYDALLRHFLVSMDEHETHNWENDPEVLHVEDANKKITLHSIDHQINVDTNGMGGNWGLSRIAKRNWSRSMVIK